MEDIIPARVVKRKYVTAVYWDPVCKRKFRARSKDVFPHERFGINLMLLVSLMRLLGLATKRVQMLLTELYGLKVSRSTILHMEGRVAEEFGEHYEKLKAEIRASEAVHFDDTGWPVSGRYRWLWAFVGKAAAWYTVERTRGGSVAEEVLGEDYSGAICSDFYPSFDKLPFRQQKVKDRDERLRRKGLLEKRVRALCSRRYTDRDCMRVRRLLRRRLRNLFTFLESEGVHWNNNAAERAMRPSVVVRKNTYGSRSDVGARNHAVLMTMNETCRMRGINFMDFGRNYFGENLGLPKG